VTPYYDDGQCVIYHGDCLDVLPHLPECDLIVTDPPYGIEFRSNQRNTMGAFEFIRGDDDPDGVVNALGAAMRKLRIGRHAYVFGPLDLSALPLGGCVELIWDKGIVGMGDVTLPWGSSHERITFGVHKPSAKNRADGEGKGAARLRRGSVLRFQRMHSTQNAAHPTEKPTLLLRELIESSSHIGESVLDPFMGSGSTLVAAKLEGRRAIGVELEERYCEIAARRLQQGSLFVAGDDVLPSDGVQESLL
jgi:DNA modification methylase